tara:strand:- start:234 stop:857 length:624 start_codon:yes stop_codon:yes gene_type:complete
MKRTVHIIGNGDHAGYFWNEPRHGMKLTCNVPPFTPPQVYATIMVDFKMMKAINEGSVTVGGEWIIGMRPKIYMGNNPTFHLKYSHHIKEFYTVLPKYVSNYTDFNCGHMAVHYAANKVKAEEIHMYGFDSLFDFNLRSTSDLFLNSDRGNNNNNRLANNWRPVWENMFREFPNTKFVLYHKHNAIKCNISSNVHVVTYDTMKSPQQ